MGAEYTYAIDKASGITYVGKSRVQLEQYTGQKMLLHKDLLINMPELFETMEVVRQAKSENKSYSNIITELYEERIKNNPSSSEARVSLEDTIIHVLQIRKV
jgi:hypothetical protein